MVRLEKLNALLRSGDEAGLRALVGGRLVRPETLAELIRPRVPFLPGSHYGYGLVVREGSGPPTFGHAGGFPRVAGELRIYDRGAWTLVVLSKVSEGAGEAMVAWDDLARRLARSSDSTPRRVSCR